MPSGLRADATIRNSPSGMRRIAAHGRVLSCRYLCHVHPLVVIVFVPNGANIRAVHAERNAPTLRDANAPFVGARPVEAVQPIGRSRQGAQRLRAVQRGQDRL